MKRAQSIGLTLLFLLLLSSNAFAEGERAAHQTQADGQLIQAQQQDEQICLSCEKGDDTAESAEDVKDRQGSFEYAYSATFASGYLWRGILLTDGPVYQPSFTISQEQISLNLWGNMDLGDVNGLGGELSEVDLTLDYTRETEELSFSAGVAHYAFPHTGATGTSEAYAAVAGGGILNPKATLWYDFGKVKGTYLNGSISHSYPFGGDKTLDISAGIGWGDAVNNEACFGVRGGAFTDLRISVEVPIEAGYNCYITPALIYSRVLDGALRKAASPDDILIFSLTFCLEH